MDRKAVETALYPFKSRKKNKLTKVEYAHEYSLGIRLGRPQEALDTLKKLEDRGLVEKNEKYKPNKELEDIQLHYEEHEQLIQGLDEEPFPEPETKFEETVNLVSEKRKVTKKEAISIVNKVRMDEEIEGDELYEYFN